MTQGCRTTDNFFTDVQITSTMLDQRGIAHPLSMKVFLKEESEFNTDDNRPSFGRGSDEHLDLQEWLLID